MARIIYNASRALGQVLAEGIDKIIDGTGDIDRFYKSYRRMSAEEAKSELEVSDHEGMKTALQTILKHLQDVELEDSLYDLDQG